MGGEGKLERGIPARLTPKEGRSFGLTVGIAFLVIAGVLAWRDFETGASVTGTLGAVLVLAGHVIPGRLGPVYRAWMGLAIAISRVTTPIVMGIIYFGLFTPVGLVRRALGRNALVRRPAETGYWIARDEGARRSDLTHQF